MKRKFISGFEKVAASRLPKWLANVHRMIKPTKKAPGFSSIGIGSLLKRRLKTK